VTTLSIRPSSVRAFAFRFGNRSTNPARGVTVALACRKLAAGKGKSAPYLKAIPVKTKAVSVPGQSQKQLVLACPQGTVPGGGGVDLGSSSLELRRQTATLRRFTFSIRNDGSSAHSAVLYGNCLTVVLPQGSAPARLRVSLQTQSTPVPPKTIVIKRPCPSGWVALAAGFDLPKGLALRGAATVESGGKWTVDNKGDSQALADLQLTCARVA
jgi:hypothetical protein